jgi:hypothetical protein
MKITSRPAPWMVMLMRSEVKPGDGASLTACVLAHAANETAMTSPAKNPRRFI